jgi:hypothetical protein
METGELLQSTPFPHAIAVFQQSSRKMLALPMLTRCCFRIYDKVAKM